MIDFNFRFKIVIFCPVSAVDFKVLFDFVTPRCAIQVSPEYAKLVFKYQKGQYGQQPGRKLTFWFDTRGEALGFADWYNTVPLIDKHPIYTCLIQEVVPEYKAVIPRPTTIEKFHQMLFLPSYYPGEVVTQTLGVKTTRELYVKQKETGKPINLNEFEREYVFFSYDKSWLVSFAELFDGAVTRFR